MGLVHLGLEIDCADLEAKLDEALSLLKRLPESVAEALLRKFCGGLEGSGFEVSVEPDLATSGTGDLGIRVRIVGLDEFIAAARNAHEGNPVHGCSSVDGNGVAGTSDSSDGWGARHVFDIRGEGE